MNIRFWASMISIFLAILDSLFNSFEQMLAGLSSEASRILFEYQNDYPFLMTDYEQNFINIPNANTKVNSIGALPIDRDYLRKYLINSPFSPSIDIKKHGTN